MKNKEQRITIKEVYEMVVKTSARLEFGLENQERLKTHFSKFIPIFITLGVVNFVLTLLVYISLQ